MHAFFYQSIHVYLRLRRKKCSFGHTLVIDLSNGTKGEPQNSPCVAPEVQQQARRLGGCVGCVRTPPTEEKVCTLEQVQF